MPFGLFESSPAAKSSSDKQRRACVREW
jgi:hypothetical protein